MQKAGWQTDLAAAFDRTPHGQTPPHRETPQAVPPPTLMDEPPHRQTLEAVPPALGIHELQGAYADATVSMLCAARLRAFFCSNGHAAESFATRTVLMMSWILAIYHCKKVAAFLSDISGAFDRVFKPYLLAKLYQFGVGETFLKFLDAYLAPRVGRLIVQGESSCDMDLANTVFQGTVLGPPLWNSFFADVAGRLVCFA